MDCPSMTRSEVDYSDLQGLVRFGYKRMTQAAYVLLSVRDVAAARSWLRNAPITSAVATDPPPSSALQVAFTATGLKALGVTRFRSLGLFLRISGRNDGRKPLAPPRGCGKQCSLAVGLGRLRQRAALGCNVLC